MQTEKIVVEMDLDKVCKKCMRFGVKGLQAEKICPSIYVANEVLDKLGKPKRIKVTIEAA
ncbi:hypothetical protein ES705_23407 [subsurface metagenome]